MSRTTKRAGEKKTQRVQSLAKRRASQPKLFKAIERRERQERARLQSARQRFVGATVHRATPTIERRRREYLEIPTVAPRPLPPRVLVASVVCAFALPILVAIATNLTPQSHIYVAVVTPPAKPLEQRPVALVLARPTKKGTVEVAHQAKNGTIEAIRPIKSSAAEFTRPSQPVAAQLAPPVAQTQPLQAATPLALSPLQVPKLPVQAPRTREARKQVFATKPVDVNRTRPSRPASQPSSPPGISSRILASVLHAIFGSNQQRKPAPQLVQRRVVIAPTSTRARSQPQNATLAAVSASPQVAIPRALAPLAFAQKPLPLKRASSFWSLNPDGNWTALVHAPPRLSNPSFVASGGRIIQLEPSAIDGNAAVVTLDSSRPVTVTISSAQGTQSVTLPAPDDQPEAFDVSARAVGPHLINVGWTPLGRGADVIAYQIYRSDGEGDRAQLVHSLPPSEHAVQDRDVESNSTYRYSVVAQTASDPVRVTTPTITTPVELTAAAPTVLNGKGMFLYFSSLAYDARNFRNYDPDTVIAEAQRAGIHAIELRMARGSCLMAQTTEARAWLDRLIDAAARANISLIAWTVPRRVTTEDVAQSVEAASYTTAEGNGFVGLALDLEAGPRYMGGGAAARDSMVRYIDEVRAAVGHRFLIVATVASPEMGHHTNDDYPYARIAAFADVLQPMEYWHYFDESSHHAYARREVAGAAQAAVARTRELAGRDIPVNMAGQSVDLEGTGSPSGREISWSLVGAKSEGAIGETFFDWAGTRPDAWAAIQAFDW